MKQAFNPRLTVLLLFILAAGFVRFFSVAGHGPLINVTPVGAMALFGGAYFASRWKAFLFPLLSLFISDMVIQHIIYNGQYGSFLYDGWIVIYLTFAFMVLLGKWMLKKVNFRNVFFAAVAASLAHWLVTDIALWIGGGIDITTGKPFVKDLGGMLKALYLAIPYMKNFFIGTAFYSAVMFGGFELAQRKFPVLQTAYSRIG